MTAVLQYTAPIKTHAQQYEETIARNIRLYLATRGLTQASLAKPLGIKPSAVSMKMLGKTSWSISDVVNAADFLDVRPEDLLDDSLVSQLDAKYRKAPVDARPRLDEVGPVGLEPTTGGLCLLITHSAPPSISVVFLRPRNGEGFIVGFHNVALCPQNNMQRHNGARKSTSISPIYVPPGSVRPGA